MPDRWPPMVGVVGFDGGYRPAVALTLPPGELTSDEGDSEVGRGPGACCYNDGTCDTISETDCISAGGTFQGEGTTCDDVTCTGACCEPGCVEDTTPDGCDLDGGTFQGFGTTCDPDPCPSVATGACCVDTDCTIETESDCTGMGGTYQGDDTTCDPNPCLPPCCGEVFQAFDGSCRFFLTKTTVLEATFDDNGSTFHRTGSASITTVETIDPDTCEYSCVRSGSDSSVETHVSTGCQTLNCFTDTAQVCGQWEDHRITHGDPGCVPVGDSHFTNPDFSDACGNSVPNSGCCPLSASFSCTTMTDTTEVTTGGDANGSWMNTATLSDECSQPTGGCCTDEGCSVETECDCGNESGGSYQGDGTTCDACMGACCDFSDNSCTITTEVACVCDFCGYAGNGTICPDDCFF